MPKKSNGISLRSNRGSSAQAEIRKNGCAPLLMCGKCSGSARNSEADLRGYSDGTDRSEKRPSNHKHFCLEIARQYTLFSAHAFRRFGKHILMPGRSRRIGSARVEKE